MTVYALSYVDRKGAGISLQSADPRPLTDRLPTLRRPATLRNSSGEIIGGVQENDGHCEDRRVRWLWWHDPDA